MEISGISSQVLNYQSAYNTSTTKEANNTSSNESNADHTQSSAVSELLGNEVNIQLSNSQGDSYKQSKETNEEKEMIGEIESANHKLEHANTEFEFSVHEKTKRIMVKVIDKDSKEVIREIPSEKILYIVAKIWEFNGLLVDEKR